MLYKSIMSCLGGSTQKIKWLLKWKTDMAGLVTRGFPAPGCVEVLTNFACRNFNITCNLNYNNYTYSSLYWAEDKNILRMAKSVFRALLDLSNWARLALITLLPRPHQSRSPNCASIMVDYRSHWLRAFSGFFFSVRGSSDQASSVGRLSHCSSTRLASQDRPSRPFLVLLHLSFLWFTRDNWMRGEPIGFPISPYISLLLLSGYRRLVTVKRRVLIASDYQLIGSRHSRDRVITVWTGLAGLLDPWISGIRGCRRFQKLSSLMHLAFSVVITLN